jgi:hypothetical protein
MFPVLFSADVVPGSSPTPVWRKWLLAGTLAAIAAGTAVLFFFDPARYAIYPVCPWHALTGWDCPGCGTLRAAHQLTHGNLAAAWRLNPLAVALLPVGCWLGLRELVWQFFGKKWPGLVTRPFFGWALAVIAVVFGIVRNLPGFHI